MFTFFVAIACVSIIFLLLFRPSLFKPKINITASLWLTWIQRHQLQAFYLVLIWCTPLVAIHGSGSRHLRGPYLNNLHLLILPAWLCLLSAYFVFMCKTNPGKVDNFNRSQTISFYGSEKQCSRCYNQKVPKRSHHCNMCNIHVLKHDHHCPWIDNCVGHYNQRFFILFLLFTEMYINYLIYLFVQLLRNICANHGVWQYLDINGIIQPTPRLMVLHFWFEHYMLTVAALVFVSFVTLVVGGFFLVQVWNVLCDRTSYEAAKSIPSTISPSQWKQNLTKVIWPQSI